MSVSQHYFLGGISPIGYQTKFSLLINKPDYYTYILKGSQGTGKSKIFEDIANEFSEYNTELFYSTIIKDCVEAIIIEDLKIIIVDGNSPHNFEPIYPAVSQEIVNLGECWDLEELQKHKKVIIYSIDECMKYINRAQRYVRAFASLNSNIYSIANSCINLEKLDAFINRLILKIFPKKSTKIGTMEFKQLSGFTSLGYATNVIPKDYTVYILDDDFFAGSDYFLKKMSEIAVEKGLNIIISECTALLNNTYEHMLIPELKIAFINCNFFNSVKIEGYKNINFNRFYDKDSLSEKKQRINFDKKACVELGVEAASTIATASDIYHKLEKLYGKSYDEDKVKFIKEKLIQNIKNRIAVD